MSTKSYFVIGVMSGTSLDGVDLVYVNFKRENSWNFSIIASDTVSYSSSWKSRLSELVYLSKEELELTNAEYTQYLASVINGFIKKQGITNLDAICSHGHTALHRPDLGYTLQIGNKPELATLTNHKVVCDFRVQDVTLGGQGAPLVPIGDEILFSEYDFCLNLGGFSNVSTATMGVRSAYDICPVNVVLNKYAEKLGKPYDAEGAIAANGELNSNLLSELNGLPYYLETPPKSLGMEWVNQFILPLMERYDLTPQNSLRTFTEHIAVQLARALNTKTSTKVLITGGGAYNKFLIKRLSRLTSSTIVIPANNVVEFKEALIFGLLGVLKLRNEVNCLSSVTGANQDHSSGAIFQP